MAAHPEVLAYLIDSAKRRGIDPNVVVKAFGHEGLNVFDPTKPDRGGDEGSSFGPYQLHYAGMSKSMPRAGMGDDFTRSTGLDARDPSTWRAQTDFVLDHLANGGTWAPWMGAAAEGITGRMGLPGGGAAPPQRPNATSPQMAADMASPGNPAMSQVTPKAPMQGPPSPAAAGIMDANAAKPDHSLREALSKAIGGFKMPAMATPAPAAAANIPAARIDTPDIAPFDPNMVANQRQQLALAMQRLNTGKLWG